MKAVTIKPHHFMDIIKLHGGGFEHFVPDPAMGHDFCRIGNLILSNPEQGLYLTIEGDDICRPCRFYQGHCIDLIHDLPGITLKDDYNRMLDSRILELYKLTDDSYTARSLCKTLYHQADLIFEVWQEEPANAAEKRFRLFTEGAKRYLERFEEE